MGNKSRKLLLVIAVIVITLGAAISNYIVKAVILFDLQNLRAQDPSFTAAYDLVKIQSAWELLSDSNIVVSPVVLGIIDTGVDASHQEFNNPKVDFGLSSSSSLFDTAPGGHGTGVTGIIGANNILGSGGFLPPNSPQMNGILSGVLRENQYRLEIQRSETVGTTTAISALMATFDVLLKRNPVAVNMSFGLAKCSALSIIQRDRSSVFFDPFCIKEDLEFADVGKTYEKIFGNHPGVLFISAAGNENIAVNDFTPANLAVRSYSNVISVGGTDLDDNRASFLSFLAKSNFGSGISMSAPAKDVYMLRPGNTYVIPDDFLSFIKDGTSIATPFVTGVAGLLKALEPEYQKYTPGLAMSPAKIKEVLIASADPINTGEPTKPLGSGCYNETASDTGCRLNAHRAVAWYLPPEPVVLNPLAISPQSFSSSLSLSLAQNLPPSSDSIIRGETSGTGVHFEIKDSDYLNVALESTATIEVFLSSRPKTVSLIIQPSPASSTQLTFSGLIPNKTYYRYDNSFKNGVPFTADDAGRHTFIQNISRAHHIWIQETQGTVFIPEDCNTVGTFNSDTATCALNRNLNNNIEITADNITLDCDNHTLSDGFRWASFGIYLNSRRNVTVRNCSVNNAAIGIAAVFSDNNTFINNRTNGNSVGILLSSSDLNTVSNTNSFANGQGLALNSFSNNNIITNNRFSDLLFGITLNQSRFNRIEANTLTGHSSTGIHITAFSTSNNIINNVISDNFFGIFMLQTLLAQGNTIADNIVNNNRFGISVGVLSPNTKVFHNNFINNTVQAEAFSTSFFDNGLPDGGNFWDNYDTPVEGCNDVNNDKFCDAPFIINSALGAQDNFPWTIRDGWKALAKIKVNLSWSKNEDPDFESYRIFRDTNPNVDLTDTLAAKITNQNQISFIDENLDAGHTYFYRVFVFDKAGLTSGSNEVSGGM